MMSSAALRVVLGEDNYLVREGVRQLLDDTADIDLVGVGTDLDSVTAAVELHQPDVLVTDIRMPPTNSDEGLQIAHRLRADRPQIGVVVLSQHAEPDYAVGLLDDGAAGRGYLLKDRLSDIRQLTHAIREVADGGSVIDPQIVDMLMTTRPGAARSPLDALTPREQAVLAHLAQGKSNAGIAAALHASDRSIEKSVGSIFAKLDLGDEPDIHRRVKAALLFLARA